MNEKINKNLDIFKSTFYQEVDVPLWRIYCKCSNYFGKPHENNYPMVDSIMQKNNCEIDQYELNVI